MQLSRPVHGLLILLLLPVLNSVEAQLSLEKKSTDSAPAHRSVRPVARLDLLL